MYHKTSFPLRKFIYLPVGYESLVEEVDTLNHKYKITPLQDLVLKLNKEDIFKFVKLQELVKQITTGSGQQLFKEFTSYYDLDTFLQDEADEYQRFLEVCQMEEDKPTERNPLIFNVSKLGCIGKAIYIDHLNTLVLVEADDKLVLTTTDKDTEKRYHQFLTSVLDVLGTRHSFDELKDTVLFYEFTKDHTGIVDVIRLSDQVK